MPTTTPGTRHEIREAKTARQCQLCPTLTFYRIVYVYGPHDVVAVPRCPIHLAKWARYHQLDIPAEARPEAALA